MPALTNRVREELLILLESELEMVHSKANSQANERWEKAEEEVARELGYGDSLTRIEHLKNEITGMQTELNTLEGSILERARNATQHEFEGADIKVETNSFGGIRRIPRIFDRDIKTYWDVLILKHLNKQIPMFKVYKNLMQLQHVIRRELLLCGNFIEARILYQNFHTKIAAAVGDEIPGLLAEVQAIPALQAPKDSV